MQKEITDTISVDFTGIDFTIGVVQEQFWYGAYDPSVSSGVGSTLGDHRLGVGYRSDGKLISYSSEVDASIGTFTLQDIIQVAIDVDNERVWFGKNNVWTGDPGAGTGAVFDTWMQHGNFSYAGETYSYKDGRVAVAAFANGDSTHIPRYVCFRILSHSWNQQYTAPSGFTPLGD
jgi:hypothetical protein